MAEMSARLAAYLDLERAMLDLDAEDDPLAEQIRTAMDPIWDALTAEERRYLNSRGMILDGGGLFCAPVDPGPPQEAKHEAAVFGDWECAV